MKQNSGEISREDAKPRLPGCRMGTHPTGMRHCARSTEPGPMHQRVRGPWVPALGRNAKDAAARPGHERDARHRHTPRLCELREATQKYIGGKILDGFATRPMTMRKQLCASL